MKYSIIFYGMNIDQTNIFEPFKQNILNHFQKRNLIYQQYMFCKSHSNKSILFMKSLTHYN